MRLFEWLGDHPKTTFALVMLLWATSETIADTLAATLSNVVLQLITYGTGV